MILRIMIYGIIFYLIWRAIRPKTRTPEDQFRNRTGRAGPGIEDVMIKDPVCQIYFPKREGIRLKKDGKELYFCSEKCRDTYLNSHH